MIIRAPFPEPITVTSTYTWQATKEFVNEHTGKIVGELCVLLPLDDVQRKHLAKLTNTGTRHRSILLNTFSQRLMYQGSKWRCNSS